MSDREKISAAIGFLFTSAILNIFVFTVVLPDKEEIILDQERIIQILNKEIRSSHKITCEWIGK